MGYSEVKKLSLQFFIGFLALTALLAIVSVLAGEFGKIQRNILATTFTISAASICSMACAAFIEKHQLRWLGLSGIVLATLSGALIIIGIWAEITNEWYFKFTVTSVVLTAAFAHGFLLLLPKLKKNHQWVQKITTMTIISLATLILIAMWGEIGSTTYYRIMAVVAILLGLETLVIPILLKLRKKESVQEERLVLQNLENDIYEDSVGKQYQVTELPGDQTSTS